MRILLNRNWMIWSSEEYNMIRKQRQLIWELYLLKESCRATKNYINTQYLKKTRYRTNIYICWQWLNWLKHQIHRSAISMKWFSLAHKLLDTQSSKQTRCNLTYNLLLTEWKSNLEQRRCRHLLLKQVQTLDWDELLKRNVKIILQSKSQSSIYNHVELDSQRKFQSSFHSHVKLATITITAIWLMTTFVLYV